MLHNISDNNYKRIKKTLLEQKPESVFLIDYAGSVPEFLGFISSPDFKIRNLYIFCEKKPAFSSRQTIRSTQEQHWTWRDYQRFLFQKNNVSFEDHKPVYPGDGSRLKNWRFQYAQGPLIRVSSKIESLLSLPPLLKIFHASLAIIGMTMQLMIPALRQKKGRIELANGHLNITVFYDGGPEKDHYGESPTIQGKMAKLLEISQGLPEQDEKVFFFITGPRHKYVEAIIDLQAKAKMQNFMIFAASMFRPKALKVAEKIKEGIFYKGTNLSIHGNKVYSDHCLSIGAGKKELWHYVHTEETS